MQIPETETLTFNAVCVLAPSDESPDEYSDNPGELVGPYTGTLRQILAELRRDADLDVARFWIRGSTLWVAPNDVDLPSILDTLRNAAAEGHWMIRSDAARQQHVLVGGGVEITIAREHSEDPDLCGWSWRLVERDSEGRILHSESSSLDSIAELQALIRGAD